MKKRRIKPLLPTLRQKKRYLAFEILSERKITDSSDVQYALWSAMLRLYGETGTAAAGFWVLPEQYVHHRQRGILKVSHTAVLQAKAALALLHKIGEEPVVARSLGVSGILQKAKHVMLNEKK